MRILVLGAGPAGLTLANRLLQRGVSDVLVLERAGEAGGLCRSAEVDGAPLDIGGGHILDTRRPRVNEFLFGFMPESEWDLYRRDSRIFIHGRHIGSPIEANIWQLDEATQRRYLEAIAAAGCNAGTPKPERFVEWISWKLGRAIAEDYMLPYNRKMFGDNLDSLGTYWLEKLPNVSYEETLRSCREHRPYGQQPGHATFYYPKAHGFGELWLRMAEALGDRLRLGVPAEALDVAARRVNGEFSADLIVNTAPWTSFARLDGLSDASLAAVSALRHTSVDIDYHPETLDSPAHWIYYPDPALPEHRRLLRPNFCPGSRGYWSETRVERSRPAAGPRFTIDYAYPLNTIGKNEARAGLLDECRAHGVLGLGRWGEWQHYNSDLVVERSLALAETL